MPFQEEECASSILEELTSSMRSRRLYVIFLEVRLKEESSPRRTFSFSRLKSLLNNLTMVAYPVRPKPNSLIQEANQYHHVAVGNV